MQTETDETQRPPRPAQSAAAARVGGGVAWYVTDAAAFETWAEIAASAGRAIQPGTTIDASGMAHTPDASGPVGVVSHGGASHTVAQVAGFLAYVARQMREQATPPAQAVAERAEAARRLAAKLDGEAEAQYAIGLFEASKLCSDAAVTLRDVTRDVRALAGQLARAEGEGARIVALLADVTDERHPEAAVRDALAHMDTLVQEGVDARNDCDNLRARRAAAERVLREIERCPQSAARNLAADYLMARDDAGAPLRARGEPAGHDTTNL